MQREIERDRYGRPLVIPPEGGKPIAYTRCTTYVDCLDDKFKLQQWQQRMVALGLAKRDDLRLAFAAVADELLEPEPSKSAKQRAQTICDQAIEAAAGSAKATRGTALHSFTERLDRGLPIEHVPAEFRADIDAYSRATQPLAAVQIERFMVQDDLRIGGTPDRIVELDGRFYIADLKTGSVDFAALKIAMQLAVYAHSKLYDIETGERSSIELDQSRAIVVHAPAGQGRCELLWANIERGWEAVQLATRVRAARSSGRSLLAKANISSDDPLPLDLTSPQKSDDVSTSPRPADAGGSAGDSSLDALRNEIASAMTQKRLGELWRLNRAVWTDELTQLAAARKALLTTKG
jgi:hypothetical protein